MRPSFRTRTSRREFLGQLGGAAAIVASRRTVSGFAAEPTFMYIGSFTGKDGGRGEGLGVYTRRGRSDPWVRIQLLTDLADPSYVIVNRSGSHVYAAHGDGTHVTAYRVDGGSGRLTVVNRQPTGGVNGVHLSIDGSDRFLAVANYASGSLSVVPINADGSLAPVSSRVTLTGTPGPHRTQQESSHPHHCPFDRTGRFIVVPDKGLDKIFVYRLDATNGTLVAANVPDVASRSGAAPRHVAFHPTQPFAYVINELDSTIATYRFDPDSGKLTPLQVHTTLPSTYTGNNTGAEVVVAPSGRFVWGSNRGHDSIAIFAVDPSTGVLTSIGWEPTQGKTPRYFGVDPSGTHLYAANQGSDTVVILRISEESGKLTPTGEVIQVATPTTIAFR